MNNGQLVHITSEIVVISTLSIFFLRRQRQLESNILSLDSKLNTVLQGYAILEQKIKDLNETLDRKVVNTQNTSPNIGFEFCSFPIPTKKGIVNPSKVQVIDEDDDEDDDDILSFDTTINTKQTPSIQNTQTPIEKVPIEKVPIEKVPVDELNPPSETASDIEKLTQEIQTEISEIK